MNDTGNSVLEEHEQFWRDHYDWLKGRGYLLRPRYCPGWVASWLGSNKDPVHCEDYYYPLHLYNLDETRIRDGKPVMLRQLRSDSRNHCAPVYEILEIPTSDSDSIERNHIVVMPFLARWNDPEFVTVDEVVDFGQQVFEGLQFMHNLNAAHNDAKDTNIMMDWFPLYDVPIHAVQSTLTSALHIRSSIIYHFNDWNLSIKYDPAMGPPLRAPGYGGDQSVPELQRKERCDPFAVDVRFTDGWEELGVPLKRNVEFLDDRISDMTQDNPLKRPTMNQVISRFEGIRKQLSWWKLRSRVSNKSVPLVFHLLYSPVHWITQLTYILRRISPVPDHCRTS
ncbi:hypothetical protein J3R30DRAFT_3654011 [Lentinula aciculospora]|uniref:Protein kinase domain-containing protein n=1 Tax=Lentinula aciculospora TaxID=153920 RepID=A0A9W9DYB7_9AGAR|nr:hypothetical protein J3R30DRAFT_3654011 [Lentinula aciculospora]